MYNGSIEISLVLLTASVYNVDGGRDQTVGSLEALTGLNDLASC